MRTYAPFTHHGDAPVPERVLHALGQWEDPPVLIGSGSAFAHVTDRDCRECDGLGVIHIDEKEHECLDCCATGRELE